MKKAFLMAACAAVFMPVAASAQSITPSASASVSTGDFGTDRDTRMGNVSVGAQWRSGGTTIQVSLPYVVIDSPGFVFAGFDGTPLVMVPDDGGPIFARDGFADPTISLSQDLSAGGFDFRATGRVKIPVQKFNDISTGETDWSVSGEISRPVGKVVPFASVGYRVYGDPELWEVQDGFSASAGFGILAGDGAVAFSYEFAETTSDFVDDAHEIVAVYDAPVTGRFRIASFATVGLSDGAPDFGAGLRLATSF